MRRIDQTGENAARCALQELLAGNREYLYANTNPADTSLSVRQETARNGQRPFAAVLTCSDAHVPPEHIFSTGIGELFVVRTAGNVVGDFELGSVEYAVERLGVSLVVIMGHSQCGAVAAALNGCAHGAMRSIADEIRLGLKGWTSEQTAIHSNIVHSKNRVMKSRFIREAVQLGQAMVVCALYNTASGKVDFFYG